MSALELVDIVDENNEVVKTVTRKEMREGKLPHRACYIALCDRQGRFLVEVRTLNKDYAPGKFDVCIGGVLQHGEDILEGSKRELLEEVGVDANKIEFEFLGVKKIPYQDGVHFLMAYLFFAKGDALTIRQKSEVSGIMYLKEDEVYKLASSTTYDAMDAFTSILQKAKSRGLY